jgi:hypothetical protein
MGEAMTELSPAQAVLDAYMTGYGWLDGPMQKDYQCVAAVLRAAALIPNIDRLRLLAIADELEGNA